MSDTLCLCPKCGRMTAKPHTLCPRCQAEEDDVLLRLESSRMTPPDDDDCEPHEPCWNCNGSGRAMGETCDWCEGSGRDDY